MHARNHEAIVFYGLFSVSIVWVAGGWFWAWRSLRDIHSPLILHFSEYTGINQIGGMADIHGMGFTGLVFVGVNFILARALRRRKSRWAGLIACANLFLAVLLFIALAAIISVNQ